MPKKNTAFIVTGIKEIDQAFDQFGKEMKKILRKNMRKGMKVLHKEVVSIFPKDTGETARGIKVRAGKDKKRGQIKIDVSSTDDNYIAKWLEFGTYDEEKEKVIMEARAPFRTAYDKEGENAEKITIEGTKKDAEDLLKRMAKENK